MTREEIAALLARRQAFIDRRDADALARLHAENGGFESLVAGTVSGRSAIVEVYQAWFKAFPDVVMTADDLLIDGDRAVLINNVVGTDSGGFLGLPATGRPFRVAIVVIYTLKDGLIQHARHVWDFTGLLVQIGVLKARPA